MPIVILSGASRSLIARGAVEEPALSLSKGPAVIPGAGTFSYVLVVAPAHVVL
jgi:hypothetical protein